MFYITGMSLLFPTRNNNSKLGLGHWAKVAVLLLAIAALTWYGKYRKPQARISREHGIAVWIVPHQRGLSALLALPDDGNDSNQVHSGLRVWLSPPREPTRIFETGSARYRGPHLDIVGDSLDLITLEQIAASVDTGGTLRWLGISGWPETLVARASGPRQTTQAKPATGRHEWFAPSRTGEDVQLDLEFLHDQAQNYTLTVTHEGYRLRFWSSPQAFAADTTQDTLSVGVLLYKITKPESVPLIHEKRVITLLWHGPAVPGSDSTRIALGADESMAIAATDIRWPTMRVKRMHLDGWKPAIQ